MSHIQPRLDLATISALAPSPTALMHEVLTRIATDRNRAIIEVNPDAQLLAEYAQVTHNTHPLAGIPVVLKDNIDTGDRMQTTAGSPALLTSRAQGDAFAITQLRHTLAIPIAKANMSELPISALPTRVAAIAGVAVNASIPTITLVAQVARVQGRRQRWQPGSCHWRLAAKPTGRLFPLQPVAVWSASNLP
jgi:fructose-specific component phosphotransferase system IIB-like protein